MQQRDEYKAKELQYDELAGIKLQLDSEIELYRNILNEAEQASGYVSPLNNNNNNNTNTGTKQSRKRKRIHMTPMGPTNNNYSFLLNKESNNVDKENTNNNTSNNNNNNNGKVETPGIARAGKNAQNDIKHALQSDGSMVEDEEMKDHEEEDCLMETPYETPGNLEGARLQFSGLDLMKGMIELQNMSETPLSLNGYSLSNQCGYQQLDLPKDVILSRNEKLRIYCGDGVEKRMIKDKDLNDGYEGNYMFWNADVWTGKDKDCAKLYNPQQQIIAQIQISPDMVDLKSQNSKQGCLVM